MHHTIHHGQAQGPVRLIRALALSSVVLAMLASCAPLHTADPGIDRPAPTPDSRAAGDVDSVLAAPGLSAAMSDLLGRADRAIQQRQWSVASGMLERALRIDPKQAQAWTRMALVKLGENNPQQGIHMAKKSNRYARNNKPLMAYNWALIARAHEQLGMSAAAQQAMHRSRQLQDTAE